MKKTHFIVSEKKWHKEMFDELKREIKDSDWFLINKKEKFNKTFLEKFNVGKIFIPHWSSIIQGNIYNNYECIVFHMTDLPYGRGGSPLQNLILRGYKKTKICAIKVNKGIDTGPIYLKKNLSLDGTANDIFLRGAKIIREMISIILKRSITPYAQKGEPTNFKRRKPEESNIIDLNEISQIFDYIRMLDCDGYPKAFIENENIRFEFTNANMTSKNQLLANVRIFRK